MRAEHSKNPTAFRVSLRSSPSSVVTISLPDFLIFFTSSGLSLKSSLVPTIILGTAEQFSLSISGTHFPLMLLKVSLFVKSKLIKKT